jgi:hypothetical protein
LLRSEIEIDFIESCLCRPPKYVSRLLFHRPRFGMCLLSKVPIEFRQRALTDIEIIRRQLRPFMRCESRQQYRKSREPRGVDHAPATPIIIDVA